MSTKRKLARRDIPIQGRDAIRDYTVYAPGMVGPDEALRFPTSRFEVMVSVDQYPHFHPVIRGTSDEWLDPRSVVVCAPGTIVYNPRMLYGKFPPAIKRWLGRNPHWGSGGSPEAWFKEELK